MPGAPFRYIKVKVQITPQKMSIEKEVVKEEWPELIVFTASGIANKEFIRLEEAEYTIDESWEYRFTCELLKSGGYFDTMEDLQSVISKVYPAQALKYVDGRFILKSVALTHVP